MKRDLISEILDKRTRSLKRAPRLHAFWTRYHRIEGALGFLQGGRRIPRRVAAELLKYIPISLVACLEAYVRMVVRDLINHGEPYRTRARKLEDIKFDLGTIIALGSARINSGEFVAHLVPISNSLDLRRHVDILLDGGFLTEWKAVPAGDGTMGDRAGPTLTALDKMFQKRHIYCHELTTKEAPSATEALMYVNVALMFVYGTEMVIQNHLGTGAKPAVEARDVQ